MPYRLLAIISEKSGLNVYEKVFSSSSVSALFKTGITTSDGLSEPQIA